jgi:hypothetical protein
MIIFLLYQDEAGFATKQSIHILNLLSALYSQAFELSHKNYYKMIQTKHI